MSFLRAVTAGVLFGALMLWIAGWSSFGLALTAIGAFVCGTVFWDPRSKDASPATNRTGVTDNARCGRDDRF